MILKLNRGGNVLSTILLLVCSTVSAQTKTEETVSGPERWAFKTNALEWLLTIPNIGVEFDLSESVYNRLTLGLSAEYNWNTWHNFSPSTVFNLFEVRPEFRYYWRSEFKSKRTDDGKRPFGEWLREDVFTNKRVNPKNWRANWVGAYLNGGTYSFKFGEKGRQGIMYGAGISLGYGLPLYEYKKGAIDIELGFALGLVMATTDVFTLNPDGDSYVRLADECKGLRLVPYPVVSELNVSFVWRNHSIKDKYKRIDYEKRNAKAAARDKKNLELMEAREQKEQAKAEKHKATENKKIRTEKPEKVKKAGKKGGKGDE